MGLSMAMTRHRHACLCQRTTHLPLLAQEFVSISRKMSTRSIIEDYERDASTATTKGISTSNAAFPTNSATSRDERSVLSPRSTASTNQRSIPSVPMMGCIVFGCGSRNNGRSANKNEGTRIRRTQVCLRQSYAQVGHMIMHDSSCVHGFEGSLKPLGGRPTWIVVQATTTKPHTKKPISAEPDAAVGPSKSITPKDL